MDRKTIRVIVLNGLLTGLAAAVPKVCLLIMDEINTPKTNDKPNPTPAE